MKSKKVFSLASLVLLSVLFSQSSFSQESSVGSVRFVQNEVKIKSKIGEMRTPAIGAPVYIEDTVMTGKDGKVKILFNNDNILILGFNSNLVINELVFDPATKESRSIFNLLSGKVRSIVKKLLTPNSQFKIKTANSDIGVLGTDFITTYDDKAQILEVYTDTGELQIESPKNLWKSLKIIEKFYTRIEKEAPPSEPRPFIKENFAPIKGELTIYEEIKPKSGDDVQGFFEGSKAPQEETQTQGEKPGMDETRTSPPPIPPVVLEPQTGKVNVTIQGIFP